MMQQVMFDFETKFTKCHQVTFSLTLRNMFFKVCLEFYASVNPLSFPI